MNYFMEADPQDGKSEGVEYKPEGEGRVILDAAFNWRSSVSLFLTRCISTPPLGAFGE